jgi:hypothetical protein
MFPYCELRTTVYVRAGSVILVIKKEVCEWHASCRCAMSVRGVLRGS